MNIVGGTDVVGRLVLLDVEAVQSHQGRGLLRIPLVLLHNRGAELLAIYGDDRSENGTPLANENFWVPIPGPAVEFLKD